MLNHTLESFLGGASDELRDRFAVDEDYERWNRVDTILGGQVRILVNVYLDEPNFARVIVGKLLNHWRDGPAWPAPICVEIYKDRLVRVDNVFLETLHCCILQIWIRAISPSPCFPIESI